MTTITTTTAASWCTKSGLIQLGKEPWERPNTSSMDYIHTVCNLGWETLGIPQAKLEDVAIRKIPCLPSIASCHFNPDLHEWWRIEGWMDMFVAIISRSFSYPYILWYDWEVQRWFPSRGRLLVPQEVVLLLPVVSGKWKDCREAQLIWKKKWFG